MKWIKGLKQLARHIFEIMEVQPDYPHVHKTAYLSHKVKVSSPKNLFMEEGTSIREGAIIMNGPVGYFKMKKWSFSSIDLLVICGNHMPVIGMPLIKVTDKIKRELDKDNKYRKPVIVDEDCWLGARVTLMPGAHVGRGSIIAAGAVVTGCVPAYSIWGGVPAKLIKWKWSIDEVIEHEKQLYSESERFTKEELEQERQNYDKKDIVNK